MTALEHDDALPVCAATGCTRPADPVLCAPDTRRLGDALAGIQTEYELLSAAPSMQGREVGSIGGTALASQRSPARLGVLTLTDRRTVMGVPGDSTSYGPVTPKAYGPWCLFCTHDTCTAWRAGRRRDIYDDEQAAGSDRAVSAFGILNGWAEQVREARDLSLPVRHVNPCATACPHHSCRLGRSRPVRVPLTVASERKVLATHLDWILAQDWAGEFHDEIRGLYAALRRANGHASTRPGYTAHCACGGRIRWVNAAAVCQACGTSIATADSIRRHATKASA